MEQVKRAGTNGHDLGLTVCVYIMSMCTCVSCGVRIGI